MNPATVFATNPFVTTVLTLPKEVTGYNYTSPYTSPYNNVSLPYTITEKTVLETTTVTTKPIEDIVYDILGDSIGDIIEDLQENEELEESEESEDIIQPEPLLIDIYHAILLYPNTSLPFSTTIKWSNSLLNSYSGTFLSNSVAIADYLSIPVRTVVQSDDSISFNK